jgi:hypothetical protein
MLKQNDVRHCSIGKPETDFTNMKKPTCVSEIVPTAWAPAILSNSTLILHARETSKFIGYYKIIVSTTSPDELNMPGLSAETSKFSRY